MQQIYSEDQQLIERIRKGDEESLVKIYQAHRAGFMQWAQATYQVDEPSAADAFQDAVVCLHNNIVKGKLLELSSTLKTYLYAIGKNILRKKLSRENHLSSEEADLVNKLYAEPLDSFTGNERQKFVAQLMEKIGEPCRTILRLFYFKGFSMQAIADEMDYKNDNVVKTQKLRCLTNLKNMVRERYSGEEFYG